MKMKSHRCSGIELTEEKRVQCGFGNRDAYRKKRPSKLSKQQTKELLAEQLSILPDFVASAPVLSDIQVHSDVWLIDRFQGLQFYHRGVAKSLGRPGRFQGSISRSQLLGSIF